MKPELRRALGFRDLLLFYIVATFGPRWIATAAAVGPSAIVIWVIAALGLFVPLVFTVLELSSRYPGEGGLYLWTKRAYGPFAGFISGWTYWGANLPYLPSLLYFVAGNALYLGGPSWQAQASNPTYFIIVATAGLTLTVWMNVVGLGVGKWLTNIGGLAAWVAPVVLIALGAVSWTRHGSATPMPAAAFVPSVGFKDLIFWSTMAFAFSGVESASTMGEEIENPRRTVPRAIVAAAVAIAALYITATVSVLLVVPAGEVSGLQGIMQAVQVMTRDAGLVWIAPAVAACIALNGLGGAAGWFAATARLPFVAGIDHFLPPAFGRLHPRWGTPHVALLVQAALALVFVWLGQAGTNVRGAYDALVSMGIITNFIPYLFMFGALITLQREPPGPEVIRVPGGPVMATVLGAVGFFTTACAIVFACVPAGDEPNKPLAVAKVIGASLVLVGIGVAVYAAGRRRALIQLEN